MDGIQTGEQIEWQKQLSCISDCRRILSLKMPTKDLAVRSCCGENVLHGWDGDQQAAVQWVATALVLERVRPSSRRGEAIRRLLLVGSPIWMCWCREEGPWNQDGRSDETPQWPHVTHFGKVIIKKKKLGCLKVHSKSKLKELSEYWRKRSESSVNLSFPAEPHRGGRGGRQEAEEAWGGEAALPWGRCQSSLQKSHQDAPPSTRLGLFTARLRIDASKLRVRLKWPLLKLSFQVAHSTRQPGAARTQSRAATQQRWEETLLSSFSGSSPC